MIVAANKEVDSSKREESKIKRAKTRSAVVVIYYNLIQLRDILLRLVVVVWEGGRGWLHHHDDHDGKVVRKFSSTKVKSARIVPFLGTGILLKTPRK
jgi:hypothetical protein